MNFQFRNIVDCISIIKKDVLTEKMKLKNGKKQNRLKTIEIGSQEKFTTKRFGEKKPNVVFISNSGI